MANMVDGRCSPEEREQNPKPLSSQEAHHCVAAAGNNPQTGTVASPKTLPTDFQPGPYDVWCGRGRTCKDSPGNVAYRQAVLQHLPAYAAAGSKIQKGLIITQIVNAIRKQCYDYHWRQNQWSECGGFIKRSAVSGEWMEVGDFLAREKTSQCFRDALSDHYSSSAQCKYQRRRAREQQQQYQQQQQHWDDQQKAEGEHPALEGRGLLPQVGENKTEHQMVR